MSERTGGERRFSDNNIDSKKSHYMYLPSIPIFLPGGGIPLNIPNFLYSFFLGRGGGGSGSGVREWKGLVFDDKTVCGENSVEVSL